jgi:TfoX/Sxy family transcriptional regulator of competence genes
LRRLITKIRNFNLPFNEEIETRIQKIVSQWKNTEVKKMFGGICHLLKGNMFCGIYRDSLILRLGEKGSEEALRSPGVRPFDITGTPMKGWVMVEQSSFKSDEALQAWLEEARNFVETLPLK